MVMRKTLIISLILGLFATGYINLSGVGEPLAMSMNQAALETSFGATGQAIASFALSSFIVYIIVVAAIYLILRSIFKSFSK
ncbi:MAG: hypothetical protein JSW41_04535 [Candidatus Aenigmatarchaeota archaeon]|nr:MAG: hypothetical protein JSW41_04535 [Candidatus Aenigmarchaeota archaeon]